MFYFQFTDLAALALLCDSGGNVFELRLKRTMGVKSIDTNCLFSGSRGEVCTVEPLNYAGLSVITSLHPKWQTTIVVAMATLSKESHKKKTVTGFSH